MIEQRWDSRGTLLKLKHVLRNGARRWSFLRLQRVPSLLRSQVRPNLPRSVLGAHNLSLAILNQSLLEAPYQTPSPIINLLAVPAC